MNPNGIIGLPLSYAYDVRRLSVAEIAAMFRARNIREAPVPGARARCGSAARCLVDSDGASS